MRIERLDYDLPPQRIATTPAEPRDSARLMIVWRDTGRVEHRRVRDLPTLGVFERGDLIVVNQTRVLSAHFEATRTATGGHVRGLYLASPDPQHWQVMLESRGTLEPGEAITLDDNASLTLIESLGNGEWKARYTGDADVLSRIGATPLPPYIRKARRRHGEPEVNPDDAERYNTVYATRPGSVAAPTAGLHFTPALLDALECIGVRRAAVTLHVGLGTFAPIRTGDINQHHMHAERIEIPAETIAAIREAKRITAVGTTTVRALESLPDPLPESFNGDTDLYITPDNGFAFRFTDMLLTNFHLPRSTLLAMVAALPGVGIDRLLAWYRVAIDEGYRFYSYGDAMLIV